MKVLEWLQYHLPRISHQLGQRVLVGGREYRLAGYHADRFAYAMDNEPFLLPVLRRVLAERRGVFLDVGANIGQTLLKLLTVDPDRAYLGFEPQLEGCFCIEQFLRKNGLTNAQVVPIALSEATGMTLLFWDQRHDATASLLPAHPYAPDRDRPHKSWVPARRGDDVVDEMRMGEIAAIKIDVEGYELEVLKGFSETLRTKRPVILFEVLSNYFWNRHVKTEVGQERSERADEIYRLLTNVGYWIYRIDDAGNEHRIERFDLDTPPRPGFGNEGRDYIARPTD